MMSRKVQLHRRNTAISIYEHTDVQIVFLYFGNPCTRSISISGRKFEYEKFGKCTLCVINRHIQRSVDGHIVFHSISIFWNLIYLVLSDIHLTK